jgi:hypothetical protein
VLVSDSGADGAIVGRDPAVEIQQEEAIDEARRDDGSISPFGGKQKASRAVAMRAA